MDRRERSADQRTALLAAFKGMQTEIWTGMPAIVQSFDPEARTCVLQPALKSKAQNKDGSFSWVTLPVLVDVVTFFPEGGGVTLTFPIKAGDEAWVSFACRCIDAWWQSGGIQVQAELRMHDLSDGFAFVGVSSKPRVIANISTQRAQLRSNDGDAFIELDPASHFIRAKTTGKFEIDADDDVLIKSGTKISLEAPLIENTAETSVTTTAPVIGFLGNMTWVGFGGGAGTVSASNMTVTYNNSNFIFNGGNVEYNGTNIKSEGRDISGRHVHPQEGGGTTNIPNPP